MQHGFGCNKKEFKIRAKKYFVFNTPSILIRISKINTNIWESIK